MISSEAAKKAFKWSLRSKTNLKGVHPDLVQVCDAALSLSPYDFIITDGLRTPEEQKQMVASGASQTLNSRHLPQQKDGLAYAIDFCVLLDGKVRWEFALYKEVSGAFKKAAAKLGVAIVWGGDWARFKDGPHIELDRKVYPGK
jgi:peptidoglycan L-alanyl-D-glutamate endopeptidase CwlK